MTDDAASGETAAIPLRGRGIAIYDPDEPGAWLQSTHTVALADDENGTEPELRQPEWEWGGED